MHSPDDTIPDVGISGALAMDLLEILTWAAYHAGDVETDARSEILRARHALSGDAVRSWMRQEEAA